MSKTVEAGRSQPEEPEQEASTETLWILGASGLVNPLSKGDAIAFARRYGIPESVLSQIRASSETLEMRKVRIPLSHVPYSVKELQQHVKQGIEQQGEDYEFGGIAELVAYLSKREQLGLPIKNPVIALAPLESNGRQYLAAGTPAEQKKMAIVLVDVGPVEEVDELSKELRDIGLTGPEDASTRFDSVFELLRGDGTGFKVLLTRKAPVR